MKTIYKFLILLSICIPAFAQDKEDCLVGNCRNGVGLKKIITTQKDPLRFDQKPLRKGLLGAPIYYYYEAGEFKGGKLNGKGYRFNLSYLNTNQLITFQEDYKKKLTLTPNENIYEWFENGDYKEGVLNGYGYLIEFDSRNRVPIRIREGEFLNGALNGNGTKIKFGLFGSQKDSSGKFILTRGKIFKGKFENDICKECTVTEKRASGEGSFSGNDLIEYLFSGWVIKNYTVPTTGSFLLDENITREKKPHEDLDGYAGKAIPTKPYRALYIGGIEIAKIEMATESSNIKRVELANGAYYVGECDEEGKPYGFGKIFNGSGDIYEGMIDNYLPNGYGLYYESKTYYRERFAKGGLFVNGKLIYGASFAPGIEPTVIWGGIDDKNGKTEFTNDFKNIYSGPYTKITYTYNEKNWTYSLKRQEKGFKINGIVTENFVIDGKNEADIKRQRTIVNGVVKKSDIVVGDIIVLNGFASPVILKSNGVIHLKNKKYFSDQQATISKYQISDFEQTCKFCNGRGSNTYTYQRKPEQVTEFFYRTEKVVGDFTILTHQVLDKMTYTKSFAPETRTNSCAICNGSGYTKNINELKE